MDCQHHRNTQRWNNGGIMIENRTEKEILLDMLSTAEQNKLITNNSETMQKIREGLITENQYVLDLSTHAHALQQLEQKIYDIYSQNDLNTATGENLDRLGRLVNVARYPAQAPRVVFDLDMLFPISEAVTIPAGTEVLFTEGCRDEGMYFTTEDVYLPVNTTLATVTAVCSELGYRKPVIAETINGLAGYPQYRVTNKSDGTSGRNIEEDDSYRERIREWASKQERGTRACIEDYLNQYTGIDSYNLVPRYEGVGTLKIVCDTLESLLPSISEDVYENCMSLLDAPPLCVLPSSHVLQNLTLYVHPRKTATAQSRDELKQRIRGQCDTFVYGGRDMNARDRQGLSIGEDFAPSELISYLQGQFPELQNIRCNQQSIINVDDNSILELDEVEIVIE